VRSPEAESERPTVRPQGRSVNETLARARSMMQSSRTTGVFRRLSSSERLRATSGPKEKKSKTASSSGSKDKPFEFALLACGDVDSDEPDDSLKKDMILDRGIVSLINEKDNEAAIREKLVSSLKGKYGLIGQNDFEFTKVNQKKISVLHLSKGTEYNYDVVKKLVGQGILYVRIRWGYEFVIEQTSDSESDFVMAYPAAENDAKTEAHLSEDENMPQSGLADELPVAAQPPISVDLSQQPGSSANVESPRTFFDTVVNEFPSNITEPTEMLRYLQKKIVRGRPLEVTDPSTDLQGETNFITVDRENILQTTFEELKSVDDPRVTFEVQFYAEQAVDSGGPRREWMRLCNQQIKIKYFDNGIKEHLSEDYFYVGQMISIALLQNGQLPVYIPEDILQAIFVGKCEQLSPCIMELKRGMDTLGIPGFGRKFPQLLYLLRPSAIAKLSVRRLLFLLKPAFSEEGSNALSREKAVYTKFVKYTREVSSGRRVVTLENILEFATGASEEPPLGFTRSPNIQFIEVDNKELTTTENEVSILLFVFSPFSCHIVILNCYFTINKIFTEGEVITSLLYIH
jgi:hypothetical protein